MPSAGALTLHEAAERLGVHYMTVYRWVRTGRLPAHRAGAEWRVDPSDVEDARARADAPRADVGVRGRPRSRAATAERLRKRLVAGDEAGAWTVLEEAMAAGATPTDVYVDIIGPAMRAVGSGWAAGTVTVAEEHRATVVTGRILGRMSPRFARRGRKRGTVVLGAPAGEVHGLPATLVADVLRGAGFDAVDLGADTPPESFVEAARSASRLVAVCIGVSSDRHDDAVVATTAALHDAAIAAPVLVGGAGVGDAARARGLGGDGWTGDDARRAVAVVEELTPRS